MTSDYLVLGILCFCHPRLEFEVLQAPLGSEDLNPDFMFTC